MPLMGLQFLLTVFAEARAEIIGPSLRYLTPDSTLRLICRVVQSTETVAFLFWYHDERMINYDPGINITTEAGELLSLVVGYCQSGTAHDHHVLSPLSQTTSTRS